ncbi:hypothetical protein RM549_02935 [Salegentibacter sp. F188]|uniref:Uncharacterized protein n=1 Tax=Autumnicola patrickiae TaxID=3075591 RepID=A0ABU3DYB5_9FLAO|nr:hypothetical protein [Salegentibacter sp. F188]MDT0688721.1 hypothetical protein [Salegentibacter sp. F188]
MKNKRFLTIVLIVGALLLIPLIAMQFTDEVVWTISDFLVAGILLFGTGLAIDLVLRKISTTKNQIIVCGIILATLFIIWAELAVGIFGTPFAGS